MTSGSTICPSCGATVAAGNRFCTGCGKPLDVPRFCGKCGAPMDANAKFCGKCGNTVAVSPGAQVQPAPVASAPVAAQTSGEPVLGVITGAQRRKGLFGFQSFSIVVTPQRLVFAEMSNKMMNEAVKEMNRRAKAAGKGMLGVIAAQMGWMNVLVEKYSAMAPDAALAEGKDNFFIPNNTIHKVSIWEQDDDDGPSWTMCKIEAVSGKYEYRLTAGNAKEARQILRNAIGAAVR